MFIESLVYSKEKAVVMLADMVDSCEVSKLNKIGKWHKPWFFKHVESFLTRGEFTEYIPLRDYYHRHSRHVIY
jgi:delta24-sterol reductase